MKKIYCKIQNCLACRSCELACAAAHSDSKALVKAIKEKQLSTSRIHVESIDEKGTLQRVRAIAVQCRQCEDALCEQACISGGIRRDEKTGDIVVNLDKCVGCWSCIMVCPVGAIVKNDETHHALKCDQCPGLDTPACIIACPTGALVLDETAEPAETEKEQS
ncbi:MAG: 4Fe-4S dicluster domain-containing protein [bacterium]|nr:4Fe-4S dicluster domain-containing protein [bacterium]